MMHDMTQATVGVRLMTTAEVAERLRVNRTTVARLVRRGELTPIALPQRGYIFEKWDVEACAARRTAGKKSSQ